MCYLVEYVPKHFIIVSQLYEMLISENFTGKWYVMYAVYHGIVFYNIAEIILFFDNMCNSVNLRSNNMELFSTILQKSYFLFDETYNSVNIRSYNMQKSYLFDNTYDSINLKSNNKVIGGIRCSISQPIMKYSEELKYIDEKHPEKISS